METYEVVARSGHRTVATVVQARDAAEAKRLAMPEIRAMLGGKKFVIVNVLKG